MTWRVAIWLIFVVPGFLCAALNSWLAFGRPISLKLQRMDAGFVSPLPLLGAVPLLVGLISVPILKAKIPAAVVVGISCLGLMDLLALMLANSLHAWSQRR